MCIQVHISVVDQLLFSVINTSVTNFGFIGLNAVGDEFLTCIARLDFLIDQLLIGIVESDFIIDHSLS